jgi:hypothetical protein
MNTHFKIFASYNILQYMCDFIHVLIFVTVSKFRKKSHINEYSDIYEKCPSTLVGANEVDIVTCLAMWLVGGVYLFGANKLANKLK